MKNKFIYFIILGLFCDFLGQNFKFGKETKKKEYVLDRYVSEIKNKKNKDLNKSFHLQDSDIEKFLKPKNNKYKKDSKLFEIKEEEQYPSMQNAFFNVFYGKKKEEEKKKYLKSKFGIKSKVKENNFENLNLSEDSDFGKGGIYGINESKKNKENGKEKNYNDYFKGLIEKKFEVIEKQEDQDKKLFEECLDKFNFYRLYYPHVSNYEEILNKENKRKVSQILNNNKVLDLEEISKDN